VELRTLGRTGVKVSVLTFGAMMLGGWGNRDRDESIRMIHRALDAGINVVDTADVYGQGESEEIVGQALRGRRDEIVLATKVNHQMGEGANRRGNSRRWIQLEVEQSLRRLGTDWIDLYQVHRPDPSCDIEETLGALTDLVRAGKVRYLGSSTFPAHEIVEASGPPSAGGSSASRASSLPTRCSCAGSRAMCCQCASATAWACSPGAPCAPDG
jgi:aryl-alcohol dehydrogenase-like predicted oxidoreductase